MNFDFSSISPTANTIATSAYLDFLPSLQFLKSLGSSRFLKTSQCLTVNGHVVVKLLVKPTTVEIDMKPYLEKLNQVKEKLKGVANTLPYHALIDSERATYLIRPYGRYSLFERLSIRPFFESIEKKWIVYQLLYTLARMHEVGVCHGDLKTENILLTSWNWVMITDIGLFKPIYLPDYNQSQFSFYFDTSQRHSCCVAPERFITQEESEKYINGNATLNTKSDIFSLGCIIAEIYSDGLPLFSLPQLFKYRKHDYVPNLDAIEDSNIKRLVQSMISLNPNERLDAKDYLIKYRQILFPDHFYTFLYSYMRSLCDTSMNKADATMNFQICDYRIDRMYRDFDKIALYFGFKKNIIETDEANNQLDPKDLIIPYRLNLPGMKSHIPQPTFQIIRPDSTNDSPCLILLSLLCHTTRNTTHSLFRVKACELILAFAEQLHDESKLDRCLPYLMNMLDDPSENVQVSALLCMTQLLTMVDTVTPINIHLFQEYILPKLQTFLKRSYMHLEKDSTLFSTSNGNSDENSSGAYVRTIFASCLPYLAVTAKKFLDMSLLFKDNMHKYNGLNADDMAFKNRSKYFIEFGDTMYQFENLTIQILTDSNIYVKIALLKNIKPLCFFFGKDKTNDVILSHLITYLNDKNAQLRLSFVSSIVSLAIFVGDISLEQYIMPLLIQAVNDPDEIVVGALIRVFSKLITLGLLKKHCFGDLINICAVLILHPTSLIRQSVLNLVLTISENLSTADFYCVLYPLVRPFFKQEVISFSWKNLYIAAHDPITRALYEAMKSWSVADQESLFWQRVQKDGIHKNVDSFGNAKVLFLKKQNGNVTNERNMTTYQQNSNRIQDFVNNFEVPLSNSDIKLINKLKSLGLNPEDLWKLATLRAYIYKVVRIKTSHIRSIDTVKITLSPKSVMADVVHSYTSSPVVVDDSDDIKDKKEFGGGNTESNVRTGHLILQNMESLKPVLTTKNWNQISTLSLLNTSNTEQNQIFDDIEGFNVFDETVQLKKFTTEVSFGYSGKNPYISKFLKSIKFEPTIDDFPEFGKPIIFSGIQQNEKEAIIKNMLITRLTEHQAPIICVATSPDSKFFVSVDAGGYMKVWDSSKLEVDILGESSVSLKFGCKVTSICFLGNRNCLAVSKLDGSIDIFKIDFVSDNFKKSSTISRVRHMQLDSIYKYPTKLSSVTTSSSIMIYMITSSGHLLAVDIKAMTTLFSYRGSVSNGYLKSLYIDEGQNWGLLGTSCGVLDLIDLQLGASVKSTKFVEGSFPIKEIIKVENTTSESKVCIIGGTGRQDVIIWDVCKCHPIIVFNSDNKDTVVSPQSYAVKDVSDGRAGVASDVSNLKVSFENDNSCTAMCYQWNIPLLQEKIYLATKDRSVIEWDFKNHENSRVIAAMGSYNTEKHFIRKSINSNLSFHQLSFKEANSALPQKSNDETIAPQDIVTSMTTLFLPYPLIVCDSGLIGETKQVLMSDYDSYELEYSGESDVDVSDDNSIGLDDIHEDMQCQIMYTFPSSKTSTGNPTHRMKFQTLCMEDIQKKMHVIVQKLAETLNFDYGVCLTLLCLYQWKEDKLIDDYMNISNIDLFYERHGLRRPKEINSSDLITRETDPAILYPKCGQRLLLSDLSVLSEYKSRRDTKQGSIQQKKSQIITEDEVKKMYNFSDDDFDNYSYDTELDAESDELILNKKVYDYQQEMSRREREEKKVKHNISLLSKYWYNLGTHYCLTHAKKYKHCPHPDCDNVVEFLGFDSDTVASLDEHMDMMLVPMVRCANQHKFCFGCNEASHSPCPCIAVKKWLKKCEDDSETLNWLESNTKDCPKCSALIEKNGGCNHMTCRKCHWQFCWVCMGDWANHCNNYRCGQYVATDKDESSAANARASLERYTFYFKVFNNQRLSFEKDRDMLLKFEVKIKELEPSMGASWIETNFYKESIRAILECRLTLKWSYAFLYYVPSCRGKSLIETAQWQLSNKVEELAKLFQDVEICDVMKRKTSFIKIKSAMLVAQDKFVETCIDIFADANTLKHIKSRI
ncbi:hypothetical protein CANINC_000758 [Pichia inconspicua]|uniref:non-specific serine/threonine protein kinase n=1 Tax=Pichia inconspicua TaxID=52247 RepID=A0A4T0X5N9_9ASCO|nr:hypothetical protein CANINC_000758 [[Candida] inconspicua]